MGGQIDSIVQQHDVMAAKIAAKQKIVATAKGGAEDDGVGAATIVRGTLAL